MKIVTYNYQKSIFETADDDYTSLAGSLKGFGKHNIPDGKYEKTIFEIYFENSKGLKRLDIEQGWTLLFLLNDLMGIDYPAFAEIDLNIKKNDKGASIGVRYDNGKVKQYKVWDELAFPPKTEKNKKARTKQMYSLCTEWGDSLIRINPFTLKEVVETVTKINEENNEIPF